jgi:glyoxylase-like metal-dependent hydrolase (beta-lactamase superfamily II)
MRRPPFHAASCLAALLAASCAEPAPLPSFSDALASAADALGTRALDGAAPLAIHASGTLDKRAEGQGLTVGEPSPGSYRESLVFEPGGRVAWDYEERRFDGTIERFGEAYASDTTRTLWIHDVGIAVPMRLASDDPTARRLRRRLPHLLIAELAREAADNSVSDRGGAAAAGGGSARRGEDGGLVLTATLEPGVDVAVTLGAESRLVRGVSYAAVLPGLGRRTVTWTYDDYREVAGGLRVPHAYASRVGDAAYTDMRVDSVGVSAEGALALPEGLRPIDLVDLSGQVVPEPRERRELAPGIYRVPQVRSGFAPLVVEFDTFLVVVDAPASFPLLGQIPAGETDPGASMSWASERLVDALAEWWPQKPIAYLVVTHHHADHAGGVRAFVDAGATVLASPETLDAVRTLATMPAADAADRLAGRTVPLLARRVERPRTITDGSRSIEVIPVGENPHAAGMLVVRIPQLGAMYVSDLVTPGPVEGYPGESHAALDRFFADWLERGSFAPDSIWAMHGARTLTRAHLARLREERR